MVGGTPSGRIRAEEFAAGEATREELLELVARARSVVQRALATVADRDLPVLATPVPATPAAAPGQPSSPAAASAHPLLRQGKPVTRLLRVLHALTHHAHHNGQLLLLRRLWQARPEG